MPTRNVVDGTWTPTGGGEVTVYMYDAPPATWKPVCMKIDFSEHTAAESVTVRTYYRIKTGGTDPTGYIMQDEVSWNLAIGFQVSIFRQFS